MTDELTKWFESEYARIVLALVIILATLFLRWLFSRFFNRFITRSTTEIKNDPTNYKFLKHTMSAIIYLVGIGAAIYVVPSLRTVAKSMLAGAGILAVAVGFASQQALSNIISGLFIVIFKPFRINDRLKLNDNVVGVVEDITLRHTVIRNYENRMVIIPNSIISQETLINSSIIEEKTCKVMDLGIGYGSSIAEAREIIQQVAMAHPMFVDNRTDEEKANGDDAVSVRATNWGDFSVNLRVWVWAKSPVNAYLMGCDLFESIKTAFEENGIEIPFPYRNVVLKNQEADEKDAQA